MIIRIAALVTVGFVTVSCGSGGVTAISRVLDDDPMTPVVAPSSPPVSTEQLTFSPDEGLTHSPLGFPYTYVDGGPYYLIGGDGLTRSFDNFEIIGEYNGIWIAYGHDDSGVGRSALLQELRDDIRDFGHVSRWSTPPIIRVAHGTPDYLINYTHFAVTMINTALPPDWQLGFDFQPATAGADPFMPGEIFITFAPRDEWPADTEPTIDTLGVSYWVYKSQDGVVITSPIWIEPDASYAAGVLKRTIGHEILHSLGRNHPIDLHGRIDTIMSYDYLDLDQMLFPIDQEMLLAVYGRLEPGTTTSNLAADLGPWDDTATHLIGDISLPDVPGSPFDEDFALFGVRMLNGRAMPWVIGPEPSTWIWDNPQLSGSASWSGRLIGFTPSARPVGGETDMMLDLATLDGAVDFTNLEQWSAGQAPSAPGTGSMWLDGDLHYTVQVHSTDGDAFGNYTPGENDDYGILDGGFFGSNHEATAGVLDRDDLTAAFGATLQ